MSYTLTTEIKKTFVTTLTDLLQDSTQSIQPYIDAEWINRLLQNKRIYNAYYDLAEQIYDELSYQLEQSPHFQHSILQQVLQQGRLAIYLPSKSNPDLAEQHIISDDEVETPSNTLETEVQQIQLLEITHETEQHDDSEGNFVDSVSVQNHECEQKALVIHTSSVHLPVVIPASDLDQKKVDDPSNTASNNLQPEAKTVKKMPYFQIPNARVGQNYQASIQMQHPVRQDVIICTDSIKIPENLGIGFDTVTQQLQGTPAQAGEFRLIFQYKNNNESQGWLSGEVTFIVTADPRSLWQVNEPDENAPYQKLHSDHQLIQAKNFNLAACSQRGRSHEHAGTFRDDDFLITQVGDTDWSILIVADGAGSATYSRQGSLLAVQSAGQVLTDYLQHHHQELDVALQQWQVGSDDEQSKTTMQQVYKNFHDIFYKAAQQAIEQIEQEANLKQVAAKMFATTLLVAVVRQCDHKTFISTFWVGDGAIAVYGQDKVRLMGKPDGGEFAGQTRFLDRSVAKQFGNRVNIGYYDDCQAVILMTDGISDPRFETDAGLANTQKWHEFWQDIEPQLQQPYPDQALLEWSKFFSAGHHDDRTLAILWQTLQDDSIEVTNE